MANFPFSINSFEIGTDDDVIPRTSWDIVKLGEFTLPGISTVTMSRSRNMVIKKPKDSSYASVKDSGLDLAKINILNVCAYEEQFDKLQEILKFFNTQLGVKANIEKDKNKLLGFPIYHPLAEINGVNSVYITEIDGPSATRPGYITTTFKCIEVHDIKKVATRQIDPGPNIAEGSAFAPTPSTPKPSADSKFLAPKK